VLFRFKLASYCSAELRVLEKTVDDCIDFGSKSPTGKILKETLKETAKSVFWRNFRN
jgi:hypothetical protein